MTETFIERMYGPSTAPTTDNKEALKTSQDYPSSLKPCKQIFCDQQVRFLETHKLSSSSKQLTERQ